MKQIRMAFAAPWLTQAPSLYGAFQKARARFAERTAVIDGVARWTWAELERESRLVTRALMASGLERGEPCIIWAVNQARWIATALALQAAGGVLVPVGTRLKGREVGDIVRRTGAKLMFCDPGFGDYDFVQNIANEHLPQLQAIVTFDRPRTPSLQALAWRAFLQRAERVSEADLDRRIAQIEPEDTADILFTSGTTGTPKGVPMTHAQSLIACEQQQSCVSRFIEGDVFAVVYPFAHNAGYRAGWQAGLLFGATILPVRGYAALDILQLIDKYRVTVLPAVPTIQQAILSHPQRTHYDLSSMRAVSTGATSIPVKLIEDMQALYGADAVSTGYGLTEAAGSVTNTRPGDRADVIATTVGRPLENLSVKLLDAARREVAQGEPGEIAVRGPQIMHGYYQDPAATSATFSEDGYLLTGDVGALDAAGNLRITGRIKDMFIVGGFNAYPAEIENEIRRLDGIEDAAVIGVPDQRLGQVGHAFVVRSSGARLDEASVLAWCRQHLANYKLPRGVTFLDALPLNTTGKVSKVALEELASRR